MKTVFLSWSGPLSESVARHFDAWLPTVIQGIEPFYSAEDIRSGARWFDVIGQHLYSNSFGILFMTPDNLEAPWLMFEAGALGKALGASHVCPLLFNLKPADLLGPLREFNARVFNSDGVWKLVRDINAARQDAAVKEDWLRTAFDRAWPELELAVADTLNDTKGTLRPVKRSVEDMVEEILELSRLMSRESRIDGSTLGSLLGLRAASKPSWIDIIASKAPQNPTVLTEETDSDQKPLEGNVP